MTLVSITKESFCEDRANYRALVAMRGDYKIVVERGEYNTFWSGTILKYPVEPENEMVFVEKLEKARPTVDEAIDAISQIFNSKYLGNGDLILPPPLNQFASIAYEWSAPDGTAWNVWRDYENGWWATWKRIGGDKFTLLKPSKTAEEALATMIEEVRIDQGDKRLLFRRFVAEINAELVSSRHSLSSDALHLLIRLRNMLEEEGKP